jgi:rhomboid family GlyGly-CTERM serine protease
LKAAAVALLVAAVAVQIMGDRAQDLLAYERGGDWWRYATCHLVHANWNHLAMNASVALVAGWLFRRRMGALALLLPAAAVSAGLYFLSPREPSYIGFSGALHGMLVCGMMRAARGGERVWWLGLALLAGKVLYEQIEGPLPGVEEAVGAPVLVRAHLYGAAGGLLAGLFRGRAKRAS